MVVSIQNFTNRFPAFDILISNTPPCLSRSPAVSQMSSSSSPFPLESACDLLSNETQSDKITLAFSFLVWILFNLIRLKLAHQQTAVYLN